VLVFFVVVIDPAIPADADIRLTRVRHLRGEPGNHRSRFMVHANTSALE
jgi:hypothetical protein